MLYRWASLTPCSLRLRPAGPSDCFGAAANCRGGLTADQRAGPPEDRAVGRGRRGYADRLLGLPVRLNPSRSLETCRVTTRYNEPCVGYFCGRGIAEAISYRRPD